MKPIVLDLKDITDSRELYQTKPHPFTWIFSYALLIIIAAALLWTCFGKIEIVVKANGQLRPEAGISTVKNIFGGEIQEVNFKQGQVVNKGDILFSINHDSLVVGRDSLQQQMDTYNGWKTCKNIGNPLSGIQMSLIQTRILFIIRRLINFFLIWTLP